MLKVKVKIDESYLEVRRAWKEVLVFEFLEERGKLKVEIVEDVRTKTLLREAIKNVKQGSLIYRTELGVIMD